MPTYIKTGHHPGNIGKFTSKGFFIRRIKNKVYRRWGAITINGRTYKKLEWAAGYPYKKKDEFETTEKAEKFKKVIN